jgi:hypothetical protein
MIGRDCKTMKKHHNACHETHGHHLGEDESGDWYLAFEADARIAELEKALRGLMGYFTSGNAIPVERATIRTDSPEVVFAKSVL